MGVLKKKNDLVEYEININTPIDSTIPMILDNIIEDCFYTYIAINEGFREITMTEEKEQELLKVLCLKVSGRLSKQIQTKLSTYYDMSDIERVIADKCFVFITSYSVNNREIKEDVRYTEDL